jgi:hypothetical protein
METEQNQQTSPSTEEQVTPAPAAPATPEQSNNYSKGGWKKWIWIYVVIAIVLYGG